MSKEIVDKIRSWMHLYRWTHYEPWHKARYDSYSCERNGYTITLKRCWGSFFVPRGEYFIEVDDWSTKIDIKTGKELWSEIESLVEQSETAWKKRDYELAIN